LAGLIRLLIVATLLRSSSKEARIYERKDSFIFFEKFYF